MLIRLLHSNCEHNLANSKLLLPGDLISPPAVHLALPTPRPSRLISALAAGLGLLYTDAAACSLIAILRPSIHPPNTTDQFLGWQRPLCRWDQYGCPSVKSKQIQMGTQGVDQNLGSKFDGGLERLNLLISDLGTILIG